MYSPRNKDTDSTGLIMKPVVLSCCLVIPATTTTKVDVPPAVPPSRIPAESPTKLSLTNNHPLFTTISDAFHSLHPARFLPFIVWIPQIRVASYCGRGDPKYLLNPSKLLSLSVLTDPNPVFPKIHHKKNHHRGGFSVVSFSVIYSRTSRRT
jgi:hypothetical protein